MLRLEAVDKFGMWYNFDGDSIVLLSKEYREKGKVWYSTSFCSYFLNLDEIDEMWKGFWEAERKAQERAGEAFHG